MPLAATAWQTARSVICSCDCIPSSSVSSAYKKAQLPSCSKGNLLVLDKQGALLGKAEVAVGVQMSQHSVHMQELELQIEDLTHQKQNSTESVRIRELESERKLAEERIAELEAQLPRDSAVGGTSDSGEPRWHKMRSTLPLNLSIEADIFMIDEWVADSVPDREHWQGSL